MNAIKRIYHILVKREVKSVLYTKRFKKFGNNSVLYKPLIIRAHSDISIGDNTTILNGVRMQVYNDLTRRDSKLEIGNDCYIGYNNTFLAGGDIIIEDGVLMASNILISSENHSVNPEDDKYYMDQKLECESVVVGEGSWLGENCKILPGVKIGKKCVIGAGSIVTKSIPDYCIAVGSPAKIIKKYDVNQHKWIVYKEVKS
ncbi:putative lipopolysaccharide biosynthesis O-acetyl transferase WbbJ [Clostridium sp. CAG:253]|nr:putative lipopolysaccharide biosynthesis O-acetyl transferase WbbJ [Clostridium sp. CAG:253]